MSHRFCRPTVAALLFTGAVVAGSAVAGPAVASADPAGQWSPDGLTYCDPYCNNYDRTAPPFSADPTAYVCTTGPNPHSAVCDFTMDIVRALPPFPAGRIAQSFGVAS